MKTICLAPYPQAEDAFDDPEACAAMERTMEATRTLRNLRSELGIAPSAKLQGAVLATDETVRTTLAANADLIAHLARLNELAVVETNPGESGGKWIGTPIAGATLFLEIGDALDIGKERDRVEKELASVAKEIEKAEAKLGNANFVARAKPEVVEEERSRLANWQAKQTGLEERKRLLGL